MTAETVLTLAAVVAFFTVFAVVLAMTERRTRRIGW